MSGVVLAGGVKIPPTIRIMFVNHFYLSAEANRSAYAQCAIMRAPFEFLNWVLYPRALYIAVGLCVVDMIPKYIL